jgi:hypothetical protein
MDFKTAQSIDNGSDILKSYHTQNLLKDLATLDDIKLTIKKLRAEGALPKDFLDSYDNLVDVVTGMRVKISEHDEQLAYIMKELDGIKSEMQKGGNHEDLIEKFAILSDKVYVVDQRVEMLEGGNHEDLIEKFKILSDKVYEVDQKVEMLAVTDLFYNNELLNHPELLKLTAKEFGMTKALYLCDGLSADFVQEAIEHQSAELVLAGCISLNHGDIN